MSATTLQLNVYHKGVLSTTLAALTGSADGHVIAITGRTTKGDGGQGLARWDATDSSTTDDGGTVWGAGTGRWKRIYVGPVSVVWYGADATGATSSTTAIQAAINTGLDVEFPPGSYLCSGLTQSTSNQRFFCVGGVARLVKNANGVIFASSGNYVKLENIEFRGEAASPTYTGHNATFSGTEPTLRHCGSMWAYAAAIKATTSNHVTIDGTCSIYQTADASSSAHCIELGQSGTVTLYHTITGIRTTQATGGIKLIETGASVISDCEFGKLTCSKGAAGSGSGGPRVVGCRITGAQTTDQANGVYIGNQMAFAPVAPWSYSITFEAGTSGNYFAFNALGATTTITNAGNVNNMILREVSSGSTNQLKFGDDTALAILTIDPAGGTFTYPKNVRTANTYGFQIADSGGAYTASVSMSAGNNLSLNNSHASGSTQVTCSNASVQLIGGTSVQLTGTTAGVQCLSYLTRLSSVSVTASTTQTQAAGVALAIVADQINVATCANVNDTIALPAAIVGRQIVVTNSGAQTLRIYPFTSDDLGTGVDTLTTLAAGATAMWWAIDSTTWKRIV